MLKAELASEGQYHDSIKEKEHTESVDWRRVARSLPMRDLINAILHWLNGRFVMVLLLVWL